MNKKGVKWLYQELPELVGKGILTQEASRKIKEYYGEVKSASSTAVALIICGTIGALLIGLGIILLLAHNWEHLSRLTRGILSFAPLLIGQALALWVLLKRPDSGAFKEGSAAFLCLMVGASIALVSQTYNIPGDPNTFLLTWMLLAAPLIYFMQASSPAAIYLVGITVWGGSNFEYPLKAVLFWPLAAVAIPHFIWSLRREIYALRSAILSLVIFICVSIAAVFSLGRSWPNSWIVIFPSLYAALYLAGQLKISGITTNWQKPLRLLGSLGLFIIAFQFTFPFVWEFNTGDYALSGWSILDARSLPDNIITLAIIVIAMLLFYDNVKRRNVIVSLFGALPLLAIFAYLAGSGRGQEYLPRLIFNIYLFVLSVSQIMGGIRKTSLPALNTGMLMLALLIITRFFDSDIGFVLKGLVFIIIGIGFLSVNVAFVRRGGGAR